MIDDLEWAHWFWQKCPATTSDGVRCDLKDDHEGYPHVATRGVYNVVWEESVGYPSIPWTENYILEVAEESGEEPSKSNDDDC